MLYTLLQSFGNLPQRSHGCLSAAEIERYSAIPNPLRRRQWLLGRWTAKTLLQQLQPALALHQFEIGSDHYGAPQLRRPADLQLHLSLAHSGRHAFAAVAPSQPVGVDIEPLRAFDGNFVRRCLSAGEQLQLSSAAAVDRNLLLTAFWCMKEATLKLLRQGGTLDPQQIDCRSEPPAADGWLPFSARIADQQVSGIWQHANLIIAVAVFGSAPPTITRLRK